MMLLYLNLWFWMALLFPVVVHQTVSQRHWMSKMLEIKSMVEMILTTLLITKIKTLNGFTGLRSQHLHQRGLVLTLCMNRAHVWRL
ncbi:hypothetical protein CsSME_00036503 [Camellia sinensis var. sinensis]